MILALSSLAALLGSALAIILNYRWVWYYLLQMKEPFTRWFTRIAVAHPLFWWGGVVTVALVAVAVAVAAPWFWRLHGIFWTGFFAWFIPHIIGYAIEHESDNPPNCLFFFWRQE